MRKLSKMISTIVSIFKSTQNSDVSEMLTRNLVEAYILCKIKLFLRLLIN